MLNCYGRDAGGTHLVALGSGDGALQTALWTDLLDPTEEEKARVGARYGIEVPTREEMVEIEPSSRLYEERGTLFMTISLVVRLDSDEPETGAVTFILQPERLVTLRYVDPISFRGALQRIERGQMTQVRPALLYLELLDAVINRFANSLERISADLDRLSRQVFDTGGGSHVRLSLDQQVVGIGRAGDLASRVRVSLVSASRAVTYFGYAPFGHAEDPLVRENLKTLARDIASLTDHAGFQSNKVNFLLDATLGRINIEQNNIIKIFSVAAVVFLPPTLVASIYGMNFRHMPELDWLAGYPMAILIMVLSAVVPYAYFKRKRWL